MGFPGCVEMTEFKNYTQLKVTSPGERTIDIPRGMTRDITRSTVIWGRIDIFLLALAEKAGLARRARAFIGCRDTSDRNSFLGKNIRGTMG